MATPSAKTNVTQFNKEILKFTKNIDKDHFSPFMRKIAIEALKRVVEKTPVGNPSLWKGKPPAGYTGGQARGNWQVSIDVPIEGISTLIDASGSTAIMTGLQEIAALKDKGIGSIIFISNNLPYILRLEDGHSTQAPEGMVSLTIEELRTMFK